MADAPGGGGWTALEVIIVLILAIALLNRIQGKEITLFPRLEQEPRRVVVKNSVPECGISVLRPKSYEKVADFVTVSGMVKPCGWDKSSEIAVYAQVIDATGMPVSEYIPIPVSTTGSDGASFFASIYMNAIPARGNGYVILIPSDDYPMTITENIVRVPITFVR